MNTALIVFNFLYAVLGIFLLFLFKNYYPKYFAEKGKNLATKQDIGEITEIVEGIKTQLTKETEILKARLALTNQHEFSIKAAEREALINLNTKFAAITAETTSFSFIPFSENNYEILDAIPKQLQEKKIDFEVARSQLILFMHDSDILEKIQSAYISVLAQEKLVLNTAVRLKSEYKQFQIKQKITKPQDYLNLQQALYTKLRVIQEEYGQQAISIYDDIADKTAQLVKVLNARIICLIHDEKNAANSALPQAGLKNMG